MKPRIHSSIVAVPLLLLLTISFVAGTVQTPAALAPQAKAERCCAKEFLDIVGLGDRADAEPGNCPGTAATGRQRQSIDQQSSPAVQILKPAFDCRRPSGSGIIRQKGPACQLALFVLLL